jgi:hypothetical protein
MTKGEQFRDLELFDRVDGHWSLGLRGSSN